MRRSDLCLFALLLPLPAMSETPRQLDAHEHGHGRVEIAFDGGTVSIALTAPGADITGFEHAAETAADKAAVDAALAVLRDPFQLFTFPAAAGCTVTSAEAGIEGEDHHDDKAAAKDHHLEAGHLEFEAAYALTCATPAALTRIEFPIFARFPSLEELDVTLAGPKAATAHEVERDTDGLALDGVM